VAIEFVHNVQIVNQSAITVQLAVAGGTDVGAICFTAIEPINESVLHGFGERSEGKESSPSWAKYLSTVEIDAGDQSGSNVMVGLGMQSRIIRRSTHDE
jgi:hypothetical protein